MITPTVKESPEPAPTLALHEISLYNTGRMRPEQAVASYAARRPLLKRLLSEIDAEKPKSRAQHHLIVGQRGMGKTMLLARIAAELKLVPAFAERFIPLVFAEEQYAVDRLSKFWLNCLDSLADARETHGDTAAVAEIDAVVHQLTASPAPSSSHDQPYADQVYAAFARAFASNGQRPVLLVDNLQMVFERLDHTQQHSLRELLMRPGSPILIGASPSPPPQTQDYGAAFYDHFKYHYLQPLSEGEMRDLLLHLAEATRRDDVRQRVEQHPARIKVLRQLTGGNPRTILSLFFLYAEDFAPTVFGDLENLLDRMTPLYKARFEELTPQQQVIASAVANHWDPVTAPRLAELCAIPSSTISAQLDRLERNGTLERVSLYGETRTGHQIAERFFNIWFLMRGASRRQRREVEFLTRFLENFYEPRERERLAGLMMLGEAPFSPDRLLWSQALADSLPTPESSVELRRHTELAALREESKEARQRLRDVIDLDSLPKATLEFAEIEKRLVALVPNNAGIAPRGFAKLVLGSRALFVNGDRERLAARSSELTSDELARIETAIGTSRESDLAHCGEAAVTWFSERLANGQIRHRTDAEDWNRAFAQAESPESLRLMVSTVPDGFGSQLSESNLKRIITEIESTNDGDAANWFAWAFVLQAKLMRFPEARTAYRKSLAIDHNQPWAWNDLGVLLASHLERHSEAEAAYRKAIDLEPSNGVFWGNLAELLHLKLGRYEEAEAAYRNATRFQPSDEAAWNNMGYLLQHHLSRVQEAKAAYQSAIKTNPRFATAWSNLAQLLEREPLRYQEAEDIHRKALQIDPNSAASWNRFGNFLCDAVGRFGEAAQAYQRALELEPFRDAIRQNLLFLRRDFMGEGTETLPLFKELTNLPDHTFPDTTALHETLFAAYEENWGLARQALEKALSIRRDGFIPETTDDWLRTGAVLVHLNYGEALLAFLRERGDTSRLRPWAEALLALQVGSPEYFQNIAPEIRLAAEVLYEGMERRLKLLPASTSRRPVVPAKKKRKPQPRRR